MDIQKKFKLNLQFFADDPGEQQKNDGEDIKDKDSDEEEKKYSEEEFNKKLQDELSRRMKQKEKEKQDAVEEAKKLAKMNKDEKNNYELNKLKDELNALRNEKALNDMKATARSMFLDKDINVTDELLNLVVTSDAEATKQNVEDFSKILDGMVQSKVREALRQDSPKNVKTSGLTRQEILDIKDDSERQNAIAQNIHLFN